MKYPFQPELLDALLKNLPSCSVACVNTNRKFIGIELDEGYFNIAKKRIEEAYDERTSC